MRKVKGSVLSYPSWSNMWEHLIMWLSSNVTCLSGWKFCKKIGKYCTMFYKPDTGQEGLNAAPMRSILKPVLVSTWTDLLRNDKLNSILKIDLKFFTNI